MDSLQVLYALLALLAGIGVGMLINALADDLPMRRNPRLPRYPNGVERPWLAWSGLAAFALGRRDGPSVWLTPQEEAERDMDLEEIAHLAYDTRLSWRYPLAELGMAALFTGIVLLAPDHPRTLVWFVFLSILALITIIDLEHRLVLYIVILPSLLITLLLNGLFPEQLPDGAERGLGEYLLGGLLGAGVFFLMFLGGGVFGDLVAALRGRSLNEVPFGFGDVLLAGLCGLMIGWRAMVFAMFITVFVGALGAILYMGLRLWQSGRYTLYTALPYGPYIVFGTVVMMLLIEPIRDWVR